MKKATLKPTNSEAAREEGQNNGRLEKGWSGGA